MDSDRSYISLRDDHHHHDTMIMTCDSGEAGRERRCRGDFCNSVIIILLGSLPRGEEREGEIERASWRT